MVSMDNQSEQTKNHREQTAQQLSPMGRLLFKYIEFDDDEVLLAEVRKHPIGLIFISITGIFIASILMIALMALALSTETLGLEFDEISGGLKGGLIAGGTTLALLTLAVTAITIFIYNRNVVYITNEKIAQVMYRSIFNRIVTQLGINNVQDVTITQRGILPRVFNYGTMLIETAGEVPNCAFTFVPKPYDNAHVIIEAHEAYIQKYGN